MCAFLSIKDNIIGDRVQPVCNRCSKIGRGCVYPTEAGKPGPKPGWRRKSLRNDTRAGLHDQSDRPSGSAASTSTIDFVSPRTSTHSPSVVAPDDICLDSASQMWPSHRIYIPAGDENEDPSPNAISEISLPRWAWMYHPQHDTLLKNAESKSTADSNQAQTHEGIIGLDEATIDQLYFL
jgi:hypothetical protein